MEALEFLRENIALIAPLIVLQLILMTVALIDLYRNESPTGPKLVWALVIIFINIVGPIVYFIFGKRR